MWKDLKKKENTPPETKEAPKPKTILQKDQKKSPRGKTNREGGIVEGESSTLTKVNFILLNSLSQRPVVFDGFVKRC